MIFFTADTHFNHTNVIRYCHRPFGSSDEMNEALIVNWNSVVTTRDEIYHLGDFGFRDSTDILSRLNGKIYFIEGSHDKHLINSPNFRARVTVLPKYYTLKVDNLRIILCHYCMRTWPRSHHGTWHLHGHSHGNLGAIGKSLDVGVDNHSFFPWSLAEVKAYMDDRPDNFNHHKKDK